MAESPQSGHPCVSSLAEVLGEQNGPLTPAPPEALPLWLPGLQTPAGWVDTTVVATAPVARMLVRRAGGCGPWDACELLNLYRVPGNISPDTVFDNADRTLRDGGANDIHIHRRDDVPTGIDGLMAVRVTGLLATGGRDVEAVYNYYAINTAVGAALIEQAAVVAADAPAALALEVECLAESVYQSLVASLHNSASTAAPGGLSPTGDALAVTTQARHLTTSIAVASGPSPTDPGPAHATEKALGPATEGSRSPTTTSASGADPHGGSNVGPGR